MRTNGQKTVAMPCSSCAAVTVIMRAASVDQLRDAQDQLAALITGVVVGAFQAATQINEMTLSFIPKLLVLSLVVALTGPWMLKTMVEYTRELILSIPQLVN